MSEIDVTYCKFARLNDVCASPINTQECKCSKIPIQMCYYKQLQQAQADIKQYSDWLDEAREDVEKAKKYNYNAGQQLIEMSQELQQLKESNKTLNKMLLILNDRLDEYKRIYGEL